MAKLNPLKKEIGVRGPVVTIVMDGVGLAPDGPGNAVKNAYTPTLDRLMEKYPWTKLRAHGTAVGLMSDDDMGTIAADTLSPEKARVLLMLALGRTRNPAEIQQMFLQY